MLVGSYPFAKPDPNNPDTVHGMLRAMAERRFPLPAELGLSQGCAALLKRLLEPEPAARVTLDEVMQVCWRVWAGSVCVCLCVFEGECVCVCERDCVCVCV